MTTQDLRTEAEEAQALVDTLLERVRSGDDDVTPDEIDSARKLAEFAELRVVAAERKAFAEAQAEAAAEQEAAATALRTLIAETPKDIVALEQKAAKAFESLMSAVEQRWAASFKAARRLRIANTEAAKYDLPDALESHGIGYDLRADRFRYTTDRGSQASLELDTLKHPERVVEAVIEPAKVMLARGSKVTSARKTQHLLADEAGED